MRRIPALERYYSLQIRTVLSSTTLLPLYLHANRSLQRTRGVGALDWTRPPLEGQLADHTLWLGMGADSIPSLDTTPLRPDGTTCALPFTWFPSMTRSSTARCVTFAMSSADLPLIRDEEAIRPSE